MRKYLISFLVIFFTVFISCKNNDEFSSSGKLTLEFSHLINGSTVTFDELIYTNAAGNTYEINEIQWFISDITLIKENQNELLLDKGGFAHYIDTDLPGTWVWEFPDDIPIGTYKAIKITFGLNGEKNLPYYFPNSPESDMQWPYNLGGENGGYHYMKLNGFWINTDQERTPFNFHVGVGQEYDNEGKVVSFVQNWFEIEIPNSSFEMKSGVIKRMNIIMNVENWFQNPNTYDHNVYGGKIMMNQEAMGKICDNGRDVFSVKSLEEDETTSGL